MKLLDVEPGTLRPNTWNTNVVGPDNEKRLGESISRLGLFKPILVRETPSGLEILGGEHRWQYAVTNRLESVPILNLGPLDDKTAKEISLVDNGRYGSDDTLQLAKLLESLGTADELASFMPYDSKEIEAIFSTVQIALDDLEVPDEEDRTPAPSQKKVQEFQLMRFKVPIADAHAIQSRIEAIMKSQKFTDEDSLTNAGMALVFLCVNNENK